MSQPYRPSHEIIVTDLGDELVLLDPSSGTMFGLNECGRRVWLALAESDPQDIAASLATDFAVDADDAYADIVQFLSTLADTRLVTYDDDAVG